MDDIEDFDLELDNVDMKMANQPDERVQEEKIEEEDVTKTVLVQEVDLIDPPAQE
jgi:hypothetical protein